MLVRSSSMQPGPPKESNQQDRITEAVDQNDHFEGVKEEVSNVLKIGHVLRGAIERGINEQNFENFVDEHLRLNVLMNF